MTAPAHPNSEHPLTARAAALMDLGRHDEAKELLGRRLAEDPEDARAWARLARCHNAAEEHEEVVAATDRVLSIDPAYYDAYLVRTIALRRLQRLEESRAAAHEAIRLEPEAWQGYAVLSEALNWPQENWPLAHEAALTAVRLGPEEVGAHYAVWKTALINGHHDVRRQAVAAALRIEPDNPWAVREWADTQAYGGSGKPAEIADTYATALAASPDDRSMRRMLDGAVVMMLRGTRWLAVICLVIAAVMVDLMPAEGEERDLPVSLGQRLYVVAWFCAVWGLGAVRRYRKSRRGVRLNVWALIRRSTWVRVIVGQSAAVTLAALVIALVPWTERTVPQILFGVALVPTLLTIGAERLFLRDTRTKS
ncbi:tetratricopeptide repeat protein [Streptomyces aurantiacus]|uniref:Uncharacterized protein n=1 Tax=Streptomyces aurantiacus JA 4570 TaxID=1286094 RepID=S4APY9_9ACTN|nr:tetratricopeptide repeat protein [Streptomyces aurantiacus]EPH43517.1 hypothetical protein STRAU_3427 [Streptomyces aurantiacus JA 4570]